MLRDPVDRTLHRTAELAGTAVSILVVDQKKGQKPVPEIPAKTVALRKLRQAVQTRIEQRLHLFPVAFRALIMPDQPCKIRKQLPVFKIPV